MNHGDEYSIQTTLNNDLEIDFGSGLVHNSIAIDYPTVLQDGQFHSLAVTWDSTNGDWIVYLDGQFIDSGTGLSAGVPLNTTNGQFVFGQEQDGPDNGYVPGQRFSGTIYDVRIWDEVRSATEIAENYRQKLPPASLPSGLIANWQFDGFDSNNEVIELVSGNNLSVQHAIGTGFIGSTPVVDLQVDENSVTGTSIGFVIAAGVQGSETFTLSDNAGGRFAIDFATGEITVANGGLLNHEVDQSHVVTVAVSDATGSYEEDFIIFVNEIDDLDKHWICDCHPWSGCHSHQPDSC